MRLSASPCVSAATLTPSVVSKRLRDDVLDPGNDDPDFGTGIEVLLRELPAEGRSHQLTVARHRRSRRHDRRIESGEPGEPGDDLALGQPLHEAPGRYVFCPSTRRTRPYSITARVWSKI